MSWLGFGSSSGSGDSSSSTGGARGQAAVESAALLESTKGALLKQLQMSIKELQVQFLDETTVITTDEASDRLLAIVEAIFIHGLKDSFLGVKGKGLFSSQPRVVEGVALGSSIANKTGGGPKPSPNFWTFVMVFSHKETLAKIDGLRLVNQDVGRGRAWLRLALNEGLLSSYLSAMSRDKVTARRHYKREAVVRDTDTLDQMARLVTGLEVFRFSLAVNSGLLNKWQPTALVLAGLLPPPDPHTTTDPIPVVAQEAVSSLEIAAAEASAIDPLAEEEALGAAAKDRIAAGGRTTVIRPIRQGMLNEEEALRMILRGGGAGSSSKGGSSLASSPVTTRDNILQLSRRKLSTSAGAETSKGRPTPTSSTPTAAAAAVTVPSHASTSSSSMVSDKAVPSPPTPPPSSGAEIEQQNNVEQNAPVVKKKKKKNSDSSSSSDDDDSSSECSEDYSSIFVARSSYDKDAAGRFNREMFDDVSDVDQDASDAAAAVRNHPCNEVLTDSGGEEDGFTNVVSRGVTHVDDSRPPPRHRQFSSSTTTSSLRSGGGGRLLPCLSGFIDSWNPFPGTERYFDTPPSGEDDPDTTTTTGVQPFAGFSFQKDVSVPGLNVADSQRFLRIFDKITQDRGLDSQNYECAECTKAIGTIFGPAKLCGYTKKYYCDDCHSDDASVIPARVVYHWDFKQYKVCKKAKVFMRAMAHEPIIEASRLAPETIEFSKELADSLDLIRKQLVFMNAYLATCLSKVKPNAKKEFDRLLAPRNYLVSDDLEPGRSVAKFSIRDFEDLHLGKLRAVLSEAAKLARNHIVKDCVLCSNRGFICELCRKGAPLYPFNLSSISQCQKCYVVFHLECSKEVESCPKCDRLEARNLNWQIAMSKAQRGAEEDDAE